MSQLHSPAHSPGYSRAHQSVPPQRPTARLGAHTSTRTGLRPADSTSAPKASLAQPGYRLRQKPPTRKALWASGSVATLALLVMVPTRMNSQAIDPSSCQTVVRSGSEISRDQISRLLAVPEGSTKAAVRQVVKEPYCLLPAPSNSPQNSVDSQKAAPKTSQASIEREAYPLAFDPTAWVVVNYETGSYVGYDFVFKP